MNTELIAISEDVIARLTALGDPVRAEGERKYFKNTINCLGTGLPKLQKLEKEMFKGYEQAWSIEKAFALCDLLMEKKLLEVTLFALTFLQRFANQLTQDDFIHCQGWLEADLCDNWAAVDHLCPHILGPVLANNPHLIDMIKVWPQSSNRWVRRASAVTFVLLARKGAFLDDAYEIAEQLFEDKEDDLVQKGNGWMLREAGMTDPSRLEVFLRKHGPDIPRTTLRYAIEKYPAGKRSDILLTTRQHVRGS